MINFSIDLHIISQLLHKLSYKFMIYESKLFLNLFFLFMIALNVVNMH